jgi:hypothetical protein
VFKNSVRQNESNSQKLFAGIFLKWSNLNRSEQVVCLAIALIPLWWLWGWSYLLTMFAMGAIAYDIFTKKKLDLNKPSLIVIFAFVFGSYTIFSRYIYAIDHGETLKIRDLAGTIDTWYASALIFWYCQNNKIKVRLEVIAWAFSLLLGQILLLWVFILEFLKQSYYIPKQSIFGLLTGKSEEFIPGVGNANFLMPYFPDDSSFIPRLTRCSFFFHGPESLALAACFIALVALELRYPWWRWSLFGGGLFILALSGTRSVIVSLLVIFGLRYFLTIGRKFGMAFLLGLIAAICFATLSVPAITDLAFNSAGDTTASLANARADSTEIRGEIYQRTWNEIAKASTDNLLFGYVAKGETVLPGYAPAQIGSHSFYLSTLLYRSGLLGTAIFAIYWISLGKLFYQQRKVQPICCLLMFCLFSFTFAVMEWESMVVPILLISINCYPVTKMQ